ncbi:MAG TPA: DUF5667 domain-containing protein [Cryptosporangiaceae bacterium]|nr:DUF5667 domain-containing protein [Cryptosporangiaceae bacterium]
MIITPSERRKAQEFDDLLSGRLAQRAASHDGLPSLATLTARLRALETGTDVDPVFRERLRTRLIAVATVRGIGSEPQFRPSPGRHAIHARPRRRPNRLVVAVGTLTGVLALSGVGVASGDAKPGDALYSIKRSREAAQLALARSDVGRGQLHLEFAKTRLAEAVTVADQPAEVSRILDEMDADMRTGMRELGGAALEQRQTAPLDLVDTFAIAERQGLLSLLDRVPPGRTRDRVLESVQLLGDIGNRSAALRGTLLCSGSLTGANATDELGPMPRGCSALGTLRPGGTSLPGDPTQRYGGPVSPSGPGLPPSASPTPSPSASDVLPDIPLSQSPSDRSGANGVLGSVSDVVGGVVGGIIGNVPR